jgi:hypothetical protein
LWPSKNRFQTFGERFSSGQGDRIGRLFADWVAFLLWVNFRENYWSSKKIFHTNGFGYILGDFFKNASGHPVNGCHVPMYTRLIGINVLKVSENRFRVKHLATWPPVPRLQHRNLKSRSRIEPWKSKKMDVKTAQCMSSPKQYFCRILGQGKIGCEKINLWCEVGRSYLGHFSPLCFAFRLQVFRFLCVPSS